MQVQRSLLVLAGLVVGGLVVACATDRPSIPYCAGEPSTPLATTQCRADPESIRLVGQLRALVEPHAGRHLVHVGFGDDSAPRSLCIERGAPSDAWRARAHVGERAPEVLALAPGPACLANTRLELNTAGAKVGEIEQAHLRCGEEMPSGAEGYIPGDVSHEHRSALFRTCLERSQIAANEIWLLDLGLVFGPSQDASERAQATAACSEAREPFDVEAGSDEERDRQRREVTDCLAQSGWAPLYSP